jgi:hypothetical protein
VNKDALGDVVDATMAGYVGVAGVALNVTGVIRDFVIAPVTAKICPPGGQKLSDFIIHGVGSLPNRQDVI